jgi:hypothetical protein
MRAASAIWPNFQFRLQARIHRFQPRHLHLLWRRQFAGLCRAARVRQGLLGKPCISRDLRRARAFCRGLPERFLLELDPVILLWILVEPLLPVLGLNCRRWSSKFIAKLGSAGGHRCRLPERHPM